MSTSRQRGLLTAAAAACISGVAVFVNSYGVKQYADPTAYTTAKNLVAALVIVTIAGAVAWTRRQAAAPPDRLPDRASLARRWRVVGVATIAVIGGSVPFVLFFEGLATASAKDAAFLQKTMVIWVALLAMVALRERLRWIHVGAIAVLIAGQALLGVHLDALRPGSGELMIMAATLLWSVEVVVAKRLLSTLSPMALATARMGLGSLLLVAWLAAEGKLALLVPTSSEGWRWVLVTGVILGLYVSTWFTALARAGAIDVTAVLVFAAVITALLDGAFRGVPVAPNAIGLLLVTGGCTAFLVAGLRRSVPTTDLLEK